MSRRILSILSALAFTTGVALAGCASTPVSAPTPSPTARASDECPRWGSEARSVSFGLDGAHNLLGMVIGTGHVGIVLAHQDDDNMCTWMPIAKKLATRGYRVLAFDFNDFGISTAAGNPVDADLAPAVAFLRGDGVTSIVLIGASMGGAAVVAAGGVISPPVDAVVSISGPSAYGLVSVSGIVAAARLTVPVLYEACSDDNLAALGAQNMYDATPKKLRTLTMFTGSEHGIALLAVGGSLQGWAPLDAFLQAHAPATAA